MFEKLMGYTFNPFTGINITEEEYVIDMAETKTLNSSSFEETIK